MKITVTGTLRDIANSAWISTTDEIKTHTRTDEDVDRVTSFLAKHMHTSPFECVTVTIKTNYKDRGLIGDCFINGKYTKSCLIDNDNYQVTVDLLNFAKICSLNKKDEVWNLFKQEHPNLAEKLSLFDFDNFGDPSEKLSDDAFEDITVEFVNCHVTEFKPHNRITWRIKCPLSISVQALRHRTASFNMVSGRYKTIKQEAVQVPDDIKEITNLSQELEKNLDIMNSDMKVCIDNYLKFMTSLKAAKKDELITNKQYKRMREFVRFSLPEGRMTELYVTFYQEDFDHFLKLRDSDHAQLEHIYLAQKMNETLNNFYEKNNLI